MKEVNVGLVGYKFMGKAHSNAYRSVRFFFPDSKALPNMKAICGRNKEAVQRACADWGWEDYETSFKKLIARDDIDLVDITTPNNAHAKMAIAAAEAGKHVFCEKPMAMSVAEGKEMVKAVEKAGVINMICFNYRRAPAVALAKKMIEDGAIGDVYHFRAVYLQDWIVDPQMPLVWRLQKRIAGSGALGDLMAHSLDTALFLIGEVDTLASTMETFIKERPLLAETTGGLSAAAGEGTGKVTVDDATTVICRFKNGALGTFEATRFALGHRNGNMWEINGSKGSLRFNLERMNELEYYNNDDPTGKQGFRTILATDGSHPYMQAYWPPAHNIGYEHTFINTVYDLMNGIATGTNPSPSFAEALKTQCVLETIEKAAKSKKWEKVKY